MPRGTPHSLPAGVGITHVDTPQLQAHLGKGVTLLGHNPCGWVALNKPEGILSHPNEGAAIDPHALLQVPYDAEQECYLITATDGTQQTWYLLHRLDSPTSGILLLANNLPLATNIRNAFREHRVKKTYTTLVSGIPRIRQGLWSDKLGKRKGANGKHVRATLDGETPAETRFRFLPQRPGTSASGRYHLIELLPLTGRTHQLRIQCAQHGYPIVGDRTYGDFKVNTQFRQATGIKRLFLHAGALSLSTTLAQQAVKISVESPLPRNFTHA